ncbi:MAG: TSUP family transporter [Pseudomonadota bacterium]
MLELGIEIALLFFEAGVAAGALNAVAGGAAFFTFAALPAELAALGRALVAPIATGVSGNLIGALASVYFGGDLFASAVPHLMGFATALFAVAPYIRRAVERQTLMPGNRGGLGPLLLLFVFSIYGGYFGAGLGQIILVALILNGYHNFHVTNAQKNAVIAAISLLVVVVQGFSGAVSVPHAIIMMLGATVGGYLGGNVSKRVPEYALGIGVIVLGTLLTVYYFVTMP